MSVARKSRKKISKTAKTKALPEKVISLIAQGSKAAMPQHLKPMLCEKREKPFDGDNWIYELKLDGYRIIAHLNKGNVALYSREQQNYTIRYTAAVDILRDLKLDALIDGEMVALNEEGKPDFSEIQNYHNGNAHLIYYVFDILWVNGYDLKSLPLIQRKNILQQLIPPNDIVKYVDHIEQTGIEFFELVEEQGLEGIIAKEKESLYVPNVRSKSWLKIAVQLMKEYVIVGWTESEHGRPFRRLMFGEYKDGKLYYVHHSSGGISEKLLYSTYNKLKAVELKEPPVVNENDAEEDTKRHWVKPVYVGQFKEKKLAKTRSGSIRHPVIFLGIREDKKPIDVVSEGEANELSEMEITTERKSQRTKKKQSKV